MEDSLTRERSASFLLLHLPVSPQSILPGHLAQLWPQAIFCPSALFYSSLDPFLPLSELFMCLCHVYCWLLKHVIKYWHHPRLQQELKYRGWQVGEWALGWINGQIDEWMREKEARLTSVLSSAHLSPHGPSRTCVLGCISSYGKLTLYIVPIT